MTKKFCVNCTHYVDSFCFHPNNGINPVTGLGFEREPLRNRTSDKACGWEGLWWQSRHEACTESKNTMEIVNEIFKYD